MQRGVINHQEFTFRIEKGTGGTLPCDSTGQRFHLVHIKLCRTLTGKNFTNGCQSPKQDVIGNSYAQYQHTGYNFFLGDLFRSHVGMLSDVHVF